MLAQQDHRVGEAERQRLLKQNIKLVPGAMKRFCRPRAYKLWGSVDELLADLYEPYVLAVDDWLRDGQPGELSCYVYNRIQWWLIRAMRRNHLINRSLPPGRYPLVFRPLLGSVLMEFGVWHGTTDEPGDALARAEVLDTITERIRGWLSPADFEMIATRFGLDGRAPQSLVAMAQVARMTPEGLGWRVRQVLGRLREECAAAGLDASDAGG